MTKKIIYTIISMVMIIAVLTGCHQGKETNTILPSEESTTAVTTTESASESTTAETTTKVAKPSTMNETTEKKTTESSTAKPTTTKASMTTTKRVTTTKKPTTTSKPTTTKKHTTTQNQTTTEEEWNCAVDGHSCKEGQIGWVNSYDEAQNKALKYIADNDASGNYRVKECYWCGKFTATVTLR